MYPCQCVILLVHYSSWNHAQIKGGSVAERLKSMRAYGWVECCSDVAGCGASSSLKDKYSWLSHLCSYIYYFMRNDEHVECWNVYVCFRWMLSNYVSLCVIRILVCIMLSFLISTFIPVHVHGGCFPICLVLVVSSSPVGGLGTLQIGIRAHVAAWASMGRENQRQRQVALCPA